MNNESRETRVIEWRGVHFTAVVLDFAEIELADKFVHQNRNAVISENGQIFHVTSLPELIPIQTPGTSIISYKFSSKQTIKVWRISSCSLHQMINFLPYFSFPPPPSDSELLLGNLTQLLSKLTLDIDICISQIAKEYITFDILRGKLSNNMTTEILKFNKLNFNVFDTVSEIKDKVATWQNKGFFCIGAI